MKKRIQNRLIAYFLISILIPSVAITTVVYVRSAIVITKKTTELLEKNLDSVSLIVKQRFEFINELTTLISLNPSINQVIAADKTTDMATNILQILALDKALSGYYLSNYYVLPNSSVVPTIYLIDKPGYAKYRLSGKVRNIAELGGAEWLPLMANNNTIVRAVGDVILVARKLYDLKDVDKAVYAALLTIEINKKYFNDLLSSRAIFPGTALLVFDAEGNRILSSDRPSSVLNDGRLGSRIAAAADSTGTMVVRGSGTAAALSFRRIDSLGWTFVSAADLDAINADQNALTRIVAALLFFCMALAFSFAAVFSRKITDPIRALVASMSSVAEDSLPAGIDYEYDDEFGYLVTQYRSMMARIRDLIDKLYESEASKREAELRAKDAQLHALQAQINPHFLYNTLDSINLHAQREGIPVISSMIEALADFYRYGLSDGRGIVTIEEETLHAESYLKIQALRYGDRLSYRVAVPFAIRKRKIVHFVLQPLVENAIQHGLQRIKEPWRIEVTAVAENGAVVIRIADNGVGADIAALNEMTRKRPSDSFGIYNVNERLLGTYGSGYGLSFSANGPRGVLAEIRIPGEMEQR